MQIYVYLGIIGLMTGVGGSFLNLSDFVFSVKLSCLGYG